MRNADADAGTRTGGGSRGTLIAVCLALASVVSAVTSLNVALPDIAGATGASQTEIGWIVDAYALIFASLLLCGGAIGDRYGRRTALLGGLVIFAAASAGAIFTSDVDVLIGLRGLLGVGAALVMPATLSTITTTFAAEARDRAVAIWSGIAGAGAVLGLVGSGTVLELSSWHGIFALNFLLAGVSIVLVAREVPETRDPEANRLDWTGAALLVASLVLLVFSIIEGPTVGWASGQTIGGLGAGVLLLSATAVWELRSPRPLLDPRLFTDRSFAAGSLTIASQFFAFFGLVFLLLQYLQIVGGLGPLPAALCLLAIAATLMPASRLATRPAERFGAAPVSFAGLLTVALGMAILSRLDTDLDYLVLFAGLAVTGLGMGTAMTPATTALTEALPERSQGVASAVNDLSRELGGALGIAVLGSILSATLADRLPGSGTGSPAEAAEATGAAALARAAFAEGLETAILTAAGVLAGAALVVGALTLRRRLPAGVDLRGPDLDATGAAELSDARAKGGRRA